MDRKGCCKVCFEPKSVSLFLFLLMIRWISTLDEGKFAKKYELKPDRHLNDPDMEKEIMEGLEDIGMDDEEDQNFVIRAIKQLVKNGLVVVCLFWLVGDIL